MVTSKLDAITLEYNYLLTTQLDSQRQYFESMLAQQEAKHQQQVAAAKAAAEQEAAAREAAAAATKEKERKHQQLQRKLVSAQVGPLLGIYCGNVIISASMGTLLGWDG